MQFMMLVKANRDFEAGQPPNPKLMEAVGKLATEAVQTGKMIATGGLLPSSHGVRIQAGGGKLSLVDGPFAEIKELVGGYAIFELSSKEEAVEMGKRFMQLHIDVMGPAFEGQLEIRPIFKSDTPARKGM